MKNSSLVNSLICALIFSLVPVTGFASGTGSGGFGRTSGSGGTTERLVDPVYELGKSIFRGRNKTYGGTKFCLPSEAEESGLIKIKRKTIKGYKEQSFQELAIDLRNCDDAEQNLLKTLAPEDFRALLHYLNQRYRLKLTA